MAKKSNFVFGSVPMIRASRSRFDLSRQKLPPTYQKRDVKGQRRNTGQGKGDV